MDARPAFSCLSFSELSLHQLYELLALRAAVFVVAQNCPYLDPDGKDPEALHLLGYTAGEMVAYARLLRLPEHQAAIGRVVVHPDYRGHGYGRELMKEAIAVTRQALSPVQIRISAQCYLTSFYESLGFRSIGESYLEDEIPHIKMVLQEAGPAGS